MFKSRNTIAIVALGIVLVGAAAYMLFARGSEQTGVVATEGPVSSAEFTFITLASQIDRIVFDTAVLDDPRFQSLRNIRTAVIPESIGKNDPFAPTPGISAPTP